MSTTYSSVRHARWSRISGIFSWASVLLLTFVLLKSICPERYCSQPFPGWVGWSSVLLVGVGFLTISRKEIASHQDYKDKCYRDQLARFKSNQEAFLSIFEIPRKLDPRVVFSLGENWQRSPLKEVTRAKIPFADNRIPVVFILSKNHVHIDPDGWKSDRKEPTREGWEWIARETGLDIIFGGFQDSVPYYLSVEGYEARPGGIWGHWFIPLSRIDSAINLANLLAEIHGNEEYHKYFFERDT